MLNSGSVFAQRPRMNSSPYTASQFGVLGLASDEEPTLTVEAITRDAITMLTMPPNVNFLEAIVLPTEQLYIGRG